MKNINVTYKESEVYEIAKKVHECMKKYDPYFLEHDGETTVKDYEKDILKDPLYTIEWLTDIINDLT